MHKNTADLALENPLMMLALLSNLFIVLKTSLVLIKHADSVNYIKS